MSARRFEFRDGKSNKFWEIEREGAELTMRWGRIGTTGQSGSKTFPSDTAAAAERSKLIRSKTDKGYVEVEITAAPKATAKPAAAKPAAAKPAAAKPAAAKKATAKKSSSKQADDEDEKPATRASAKKADENKPGAKKAAKKASAKQTDVAAGDTPSDAASGSVAALNDIPDGEEVSVPGSGSSSYTLRNVGGAYSCTCPAWRHQGLPAERRTCKHLRKFRGDAAEEARLGGALPQRAVRSSGGGGGDGDGDEASNAPPLLLAHRWEDQDPTGWWISEKLDGVRAYWDGKQFISRLGNAYLAPEWFTQGLPDFPLDGELFAGRGRFQHAVSIARRMDKGKDWASLKFVIFDAPALEHAFEHRIKHIVDHFEENPWEHAQVLEHRACEGHDDLKAELERVEELGGEGVMLRKPGSRYVAGRSETLLKVKSFLDTEARVTGYQDGTGKHKGRVGALLVELPDGTKFKVGTGLSDAERENPPEIGAIVTVRYQELTDAGVPRFPSYVGARDDVDWDKLVEAAKS